jgi:hypothetical protein
MHSEQPLFKSLRPDITEILRRVEDAQQVLGTPCTARAVAKHLGATDKKGEGLPSIYIALDLLDLQKQGAVTSAVLERLTQGLSLNALQQLARTLRKNQ